MTGTSQSIDIAGAGLAGLSAAIAARRYGARATVYERNGDVGGRFSGEFQRLENWTTEVDVLEELATIGIEPTFDCVPYYEVVLFDDGGRAHQCRDSQPIFYLVERGAGESTLDGALARQARAVGADILLQSPCSVPPAGGIVACGPCRAEIVTVGYRFETDAADGAYCSLSPRHSKAGYACLLIHRGRGVVTTNLFSDFHNERYYLGEAVEFFESTLGVKMRHQRGFGGAGMYSPPVSVHRNGVLLVGGAAGFQDAFAGCGIRYALVSGYLAAESLLASVPACYDARWRARIDNELQLGLVNRYLYAGLGAPLRRLLVNNLAGTESVRTRLRRWYTKGVLKSLILPLARRAVMRATAAPCAEPGCRCTWCRCESERGNRDWAEGVPVMPRSQAS